MTSSSKALLVMVAIAALGVGVGAGFVSKSARLTNQVDVHALINASLASGKSDGSSVVVSSQLGKLTLVNFWASWCAPCREEMPVFEAVYQQAANQGLQIIGIAIDSVDKAQPMLDSMGISYPILYAQQSGMLLMEKVGNPQGFLPYSLLIDQHGQVVERVLGTVHQHDLQRWVEEYL